MDRKVLKWFENVERRTKRVYESDVEGRRSVSRQCGVTGAEGSDSQMHRQRAVQGLSEWNKRRFQ